MSAGAPSSEQQLSGPVVHVGAAPRDQVEIGAAQAGEERMRLEQLADVSRLHGSSSLGLRPGSVSTTAAGHGAGPSMRAATSSVRSMPTGHQVMQRPHPTQPEWPNWSIHVPSLWVSHWR